MQFLVALSALVAAVAAAPLNQNNTEAAPIAKRYSGGVATFYSQAGTEGACGGYYDDWSKVAALQSSMYSGGSHCFKGITVKNNNNGKTVWAKVTDECPSCENSQSVDLSKGAFSSIASWEEGEVPITWWFD